MKSKKKYNPKPANYKSTWTEKLCAAVVVLLGLYGVFRFAQPVKVFTPTFYLGQHVHYKVPYFYSHVCFSYGTIETFYSGMGVYAITPPVEERQNGCPGTMYIKPENINGD